MSTAVSIIQTIVDLGGKISDCHRSTHDALREIANYSHRKKLTVATQQLKPLSDFFLWVGAGNMSLELSFVKKYPQIASTMIVTTYAPEHKLGLLAKRNKIKLETLGITVLHKIDATNLHSCEFFRGKNMKHIFFSHPHTGTQKNDTALLISHFFQSASQIQKEKSKIHLFRIRGGKKTQFPDGNFDRNQHYMKLYGLYENDQYGFTLYKKHRFNTERYPGYQHQQTRKMRGAINVKDNNSIEYVFKKHNRNDTQDLNNHYNSDEISSDSESDSDYDSFNLG